MPLSRLSKDCISPITLSTNFDSNYALAPLSSIVHPLFVFKDYGNANATKHFRSLPKQNWAQYFDDKVVVGEEESEKEEREE